MKQTTKRFTSMVIGLVFLTAAFIVYFLFIEPAYEEAKVIKAENNAQGQFIKTEQDTVKTVQNLISSYEGEGQSQIQSAVSTALPLNEDVVEGIAQLSGIAAQSGISIDSITVTVTALQNPAKKTGAGISTAADFTAALQKPVGTITLNLKFGGQYENLKQFIALLATNIRIFDVKTMKFSSQTVTQGSGQTKTILQTYNLDMAVTAYYQST